jgi:HAMP domain-containing protein
LFLALLVAAVALFLIVPRLFAAARTSRDVSDLGTLSDRWLAEHRSSRQQP